MYLLIMFTQNEGIQLQNLCLKVRQVRYTKNKEPVLISICIQYMKWSLFILIDVICYCLHTKSVIIYFSIAH